MRDRWRGIRMMQLAGATLAIVWPRESFVERLGDGWYVDDGVDAARQALDELLGMLSEAHRSSPAPSCASPAAPELQAPVLWRSGVSVTARSARAPHFALVAAWSNRTHFGAIE